LGRIEKEELVMSIRCKDLGTNLSAEIPGFCPTASATTGTINDACGQATTFPTGFVNHPTTIDLQPLRAQMRQALGL
jgi:hypothetical protein